MRGSQELRKERTVHTRTAQLFVKLASWAGALEEEDEARARAASASAASARASASIPPFHATLRGTAREHGRRGSTRSGASRLVRSAPPRRDCLLAHRQTRTSGASETRALLVHARTTPPTLVAQLHAVTAARGPPRLLSTGLRPLSHRPTAQRSPATQQTTP